MLSRLSVVDPIAEPSGSNFKVDSAEGSKLPNPALALPNEPGLGSQIDWSCTL